MLYTLFPSPLRCHLVSVLMDCAEFVHRFNEEIILLTGTTLRRIPMLLAIRIDSKDIPFRFDELGQSAYPLRLIGGDGLKSSNARCVFVLGPVYEYSYSPETRLRVMP
jgi:hypothetical protein